MSRVSGKPQMHSYIDVHKVRKVQFGILNPTEIKEMSVVKIECERIYDERSQMPNDNALNDPRMGTMNKNLKCYTCKGGQEECPGHFGHIELAKPVYHFGFIENVRQVLKSVCCNCSKLLAPRDKLKIADINSLKSNKAKFTRVYKEAQKVSTCDQETQGCGAVQPKYTIKIKEMCIVREAAANSGENNPNNKKQFFADDAIKILSRISDEDCRTMGYNPEHSRPEWMLIQNLPVAPPPVRPSVQMTSSMRQEDDLTYAYQQILKHSNQLRSYMEKGANDQIINERRMCIQYFVATLMDNEIQGMATSKHKSGKPLKAIRSRLKGKEGRLRGNLMGKRVDFSARTVITPDPNLMLDQLGVPRAIAENLTIPETVTNQNLAEMRQLVDNGPNKWPGAKYIIRNDDRQIDLSALKNRSDAHLETGYKVERHIRDDDFVLFNRQPSLHKMSIMGHRVKVLPYSTFRLNLSVTTPYNADFDGDEMNMHVPQSYETKAEIKEIMHVPRQIVSPQSNKPVMGIVQDSLLGIMLLTERETFIEYDVVMNLLMWVTQFNGVVPEPAILKPKPLWTGKQMISLIFPNVNFYRYAGGEGKFLTNADPKDESIIISKGELLAGVLSKSIVGNSPGGLIHIIWKDHGPEPTRDFMSQVQTLVNNWLVYHGFTIGVQDIIATQATNIEIEKILNKSRDEVKQIILKAQMGKLTFQPGKNMIESFEFHMNNALNKTRDDAGNLAFKNLDAKNKLKNMVSAGSKGGPINISQIMACVGQQNVEGKRIPFGFSKRTLPHFSKDDFGPESKGFVENSYVKGLTPSEFYFHAMGGREGVIDTAVKTSETGYIQRRLIKALEDVMVKYDGTIRNSHQHIIQFLYGEDGMAGEYIEEVVIDSMTSKDDAMNRDCNFMHIEGTHTGAALQTRLEDKLKQCMDLVNVQEVVTSAQIQLALENEFQVIKEDRRIMRSDIFKRSDAKMYLPVNIPRLLTKAKQDFNIRPKHITDLTPMYVLKELENLMNLISVVPGHIKFPNSLSAEANTNSTILIKSYIRYKLCTKQIIQINRLSQVAFDWLLGEIKSIFEKSAAHPGEMVGSIAAQSIGEPATQMTLNTFHLAGVSSKNVTLGVPRLKEIINVAKNIKTPSLTIYLKKMFRSRQEATQKIAADIEHTTLGHVVKSSGIYYDPDPLKTIIQADQDLVQLYNDVPMDIANAGTLRVNPWVLRLELDQDKLMSKQLTLQQIEDKITQYFGDSVSIMKTDENVKQLVMRLRFKDLEDDESTTVDQFIKELEDQIFNDISMKGIQQIQKVYASKYLEYEVDPKTGAFESKEDGLVWDDQGRQVMKPDGTQLMDKYWMIETDGVALAKILTLPTVDKKRTFSNDIIEILQVLGIEAVRMSLINELRKVLGVYGIYVNYRHLSTLCDIMTQRGILTSITRHGINRTETGPLRKCSFEETVEILVEAAVFAEQDNLSGITENIIMGQLAPLGTGCFDLMVDVEQLAKHAQQDFDMNNNPGLLTPTYEDDQLAQYTPIGDQTPSYNDGGATPGGMRSLYGGPGSTHGGMFSPGGYNAQSPTYGQNMQSPVYNTSPVYQPGQTGKTPMYGGYQSPIYNVTMGQPNNYVGQNNSPSYSPTGPMQSPAYASYSPGYSQNAGGGSSQQRFSGGVTQPVVSPSYSPTGGQTNYNPYSPLYASSQSPSYGQGQSTIRPQAPNSSQRYSLDSAHSGGSSANASGVHYSPAYNPGQIWVPTSPAYNSTSSPAYNPNVGGGSNAQRPAYNPAMKEEGDKEEEDGDEGKNEDEKKK